MFLEHILLDEAGNIRPQYDPDNAVTDGYSPHQDNGHDRMEVAVQESEDHQSATTHSDHHHVASPAKNEPERYEQERPVANPLKRKLDQPISGDFLFALEGIDIAQYLPSQPLLEKVAAFFCTSFHHWIPYIHKQRLQTRVREGLRDPGRDLVLHALVAVSLRHMNQDELFLDSDQIRQQTSISRLIVETYSVRNVSIESLQALIFIVFDLVSNSTR